ncbi:MAG: DUF1016 N-terminal domain-containing protein [Chitinophagaceae bacterium]
MSKTAVGKNLYESVRTLIEQAQQYIVRNVNSTMVLSYFEIGRIIIEDEQSGNKRATYAKETLKHLSKDLTKEFGKGYSITNLEYFRNFYFLYHNRISQTVSGISKKEQKIQHQENPRQCCGN